MFFPTGKTKGHYSILIEGVAVATCGYHIEIMQQALLEFMNNHKLTVNHENSLYELRKYLYLLRCSLLHTEGELLARWQFKRTNASPKETKTVEKLQKKGLIIKIPIKKESGTLISYSEKSYLYYKLTLKIKLKRNSNQIHPVVKLNRTMIYKLILLSYHVLAITKKRNSNTLYKYLERTTVKQI